MLKVLIMGVATTVVAQQANSLITLRQTYEIQQQSILTQYAKTLEAMIAMFKKKGDLDNILILQAEQKRFETEKTVQNPSDAKESFRPATDEYHKSMVALLEKYIAALGGLIKKEVAEDRIEEAKLVKAEKDKAAFILADIQAKLLQKTAMEKPKLEKPTAPAPSQPDTKPKDFKELVSDPDGTCTVNLGQPDVQGMEVCINGAVAGMGRYNNTLKWYWGDGKKTDSLFPARHKYKARGEYTVQVVGIDDKKRRTVSTTIVNIE